MLRLNTFSSVIRPTMWPSTGTWFALLFIFFNLTLTLLQGTSEVEEQVLYLNPFLEHCCQSVKKLQPAGRKECVCHISPILITCAHQALSESLTKVFPRLQTQLRRFRHGTFSSCHAEPQMPSACLKWFWTRVLTARTVACEKHQSNDFSLLSTTRPVDIRNLREMKIGCVWLSWGTGRSWKTSDLIASVHQRAAFRFLSINLLQASALGWSELFCLEGFEMQYFQKFKIPRLFGYFVCQFKHYHWNSVASKIKVRVRKTLHTSACRVAFVDWT